MGKKMKFLAVFRSMEAGRHQWRWASCNNPRTLSFRAGDNTFKTLNSIFSDPFSGELETASSWPFTTSSTSASFSSDSDHSEPKSLDIVIRGAKSARLFFEPNYTNSILEKIEKEKEEEILEKEEDNLPFQESKVIAMESKNPYLDFLKSMEEMVEFNKIREWGRLEELLSWYLRINGEKNHGFIVGAFLDLLLRLSTSSSANVLCSTDIVSFTSAETSFASSPCSSSVNEIDDNDVLS